MTQIDSTSAQPGAPGAATIIRGIVRSMRPYQWVKNLFVLAPLVFSKSFLLLEKNLQGAAAMLLFCMAASTVYLLNDIFDIEKDRRHPTKSRRPIPAGELPLPVARLAAGVLGLGAVSGAFALNPVVGLVISGYLVMNLAYSLWLKHIAFVDVSIIASGFVLRVLAGAFAIQVFISEWLIVCTFFLALYLGLGKRAHELRLFLSGEVQKSRKVLERYRAEYLDFALLFMAGMTIAVYTIYTLTAALPDQPLRSQDTPFSSPWLPITIPFAVFGITRFYQLIQKDCPDSPTDLLLHDRIFIVNMALWASVILALALL